MGFDDVYLGDTTIGVREVLEAPFQLAEFFAKTGEGLGGLRPKNPELLLSALGRQFSEFGGRAKWNNRIQIVASLLYGLIKNHPFHDANKRTAFLISILHLQKIGRTPTVAGEKFEDFTVAIAEDKLNEFGGRAPIASKDHDANIEAISYFLRRNTREIDLKMKLVTYRELETILKRRDIEFKNPNGNRIDVMKRSSNGELIRIAHIGFHGWSREVSRKDIHVVRTSAKLDAAHGYDSQAFFQGVEDPLSLIEKYREPLRRLAFR